jgi:hypothetical protein
MEVRMPDFGCLYNCGSGASSTQEYHVYPASASTLNLTLPSGLICDKCNQYFSEIENYFTNYHPGSSQRVWDGVITRKGKTPTFTHESGKMTRVDGEDARHISTNLGGVRFERHPNGDYTIVSSYTPQSFDASKISRVLHKIAFETLLYYPIDPNLNPLSDRFLLLRDFVRRPKSSLDFQPFAWMRREEAQEHPCIVSIQDPDTNNVVAEMCEIHFPGIVYIIAYPPWPSPSSLWESIIDANVVNTSGVKSLEPEEIRIPLVLRKNQT